MAIRIQDLMADGATLTAWCRNCRKHQVLWQPLSKSKMPKEQDVLAFQRRIVCQKCRQPGELWVNFHTPELVKLNSRRLWCFNNLPYRDANRDDNEKGEA